MEDQILIGVLIFAIGVIAGRITAKTPVVTITHHNYGSEKNYNHKDSIPGDITISGHPAFSNRFTKLDERW